MERQQSRKSEKQGHGGYSEKSNINVIGASEANIRVGQKQYLKCEVG